MLIGITAVIVSGPIGITLGVIGGFFGGRIDDVVMFVITTRLEIPLILVALAVVSLVDSSLTVVVRTLDYVSAGWAAGCSRARILGREVLPNILSPLAVVATLEMAVAILLEAVLSFLGLGVPPPLPLLGADDLGGQGIHGLRPVGDLRAPGSRYSCR